jgi:hypothetical protein
MRNFGWFLPTNKTLRRTHKRCFSEAMFLGGDPCIEKVSRVEATPNLFPLYNILLATPLIDFLFLKVNVSVFG